MRHILLDDDARTYAITSEQKVWDKYEISSDNIVIIKAFDEGRVDYVGKMNAKVQ